MREKVIIVAVFLLAFLAAVAFEWKIRRDVLRSENPSHVQYPAAPAKPTAPADLKKLLCRLDVASCRAKLQYSIDQQWQGYGGYGYIWVGFAWPRGMDWVEAVQVVPTYLAGGNYPLSYTTREEAVEGLAKMIESGLPNRIPAHEQATEDHPVAKPIYGPASCDPHRQCQ